MEHLETIALLQARYAAAVTQVESFAGAHRTLLQAVGVATVMTLGGVGGFFLAKGALAAKAGLATQAAPLAAGLVGGTLAGAGLTRYQVQRVQEQLTEQMAQLGLVQAEHERLVHLLATTQAQLSALPTEPVEPTLVTTPLPVVASPELPPAAAVQAIRAICLDRLEAIQGITPAIAARLNQGGILTYADLAAQTVTRVQRLLAPDLPIAESVIAHWHDNARTLAAGQQLLAGG